MNFQHATCLNKYNNNNNNLFSKLQKKIHIYEQICLAEPHEVAVRKTEKKQYK